jgi:hypothetical protein
VGSESSSEEQVEPAQLQLSHMKKVLKDLEESVSGESE